MRQIMNGVAEAWQSWLSGEGQRRTIVQGAVSLAFFSVLALYSYYREEARRYVPSLLVISFACLNILVRGLFFPSLSRPVGIGAIWRLADGAVAIAGAIMYTREWRRRRN
jgi:hypothetical protein